jgi:uncharacterized membrane protein YkoI
MNRSSFRMFLAAVACSTISSLALARSLTFEQLPPAVQATVTREIQGGTIKEIELEQRQGGATVYEVEFYLNGAQYELDIAPDGKLLSRKLD